MMYQVNTAGDAIKFCREAASIRRCHTVPIIGDYNVGHHCFNMLTMLLLLKPMASRELIWAIVQHDIPERLTGDIPSPAKWALNMVDLPEVEDTILAAVFGTNYESLLNDVDRSWLKGLDILELYLFCRDQIEMGNKNFEVMRKRIVNHVRYSQQAYCSELMSLLFLIDSATWDMMPDLGEPNVSQ